MTDGCIVNAVVENVQPITATVTSQTALVASLDTSSVSAEIISPVSVDAAVLTATELSSTVEEAQAITAVVESLTELAAEIQTMGMTADQIAKLNSIAWNARNYQPDYISLVRATAYSVADGDSTPWPIGVTMTQTVQWAVAHPAWRGSGIMEIDLTFEYIISAGGPFTMSIELQTADDFQTDNTSAATSSFGLPESWSTVATWTSPALTADNAVHRIWFHTDMIHEGNTSTSGFMQTDPYRFTVDKTTAPTVTESAGMLFTTIDTSKDFLMRIRAMTDYNPAGPPTEYMTLQSAYVGLKHPRDGHGY